MNKAGAWLLAIVVALGLSTYALADYTGRGSPDPKTHVVVGYRHDGSSSAGSWYRSQVTAVDAGDVGALSSSGLTTSVPILYTAGWSQVSLSCLSNVATFTCTLTPLYGWSDSSGEVQWVTGSDVTLSCDSEYTFQSVYTSNKTYVDTDGHPFMRILVKSMSSGNGADPVSHVLTRLAARVN